MTTGEDVFTEHRGLLFSIAYEITGSVADSEDVLQESYIRWAGTDTESVDNPRAYAAQIVTRQALNSLRSAQRRREDYVGPWLPEPILTSPDAADEVELAESVSTAMLLVLETLTPVERTVFVMREVFGFEYRRIAETVDRTESAVRQIAHRAREHVHAGQRRFTPAGDETERVVAAFLTAATTGDLDGLLSLLAPDVRYLADGGGKVNAARVPVFGSAKVARLFLGLVRHPLPDMIIEPAVVNSMPGFLVYSAGVLDMVLHLEIDDHLITGVYVVRNPDKLAHLRARPDASDQA
ncbi:RNA polymerase sigma-70 factor, ECF subfamily [Rhodococcus rhodochrous J3]|uniref:RNA polymerase sigma-70 factor, ECF subfamily n=1 Tax=Rhodococcus rhodochrous J3 TaxID=903528 RepID=A0ABY1MA07_RHORH|nr:RNA polymerase sigma-70 factor [Rhodococcus rhodochrous]MBF4479791.1 RNA polymerase sigma-70 factor [Rhodococcus rhodochrous]MCB8912909.1 RNA polymerase sigma-70 factor [Rhodococcus rhodochrous]TWH53064.1 RNA polymerase sigma-70 factor (ECF subfamily) [Rhodococcus rhodochrous J38]SMG33476.1 RNA polymerase sigma-70 factor, ECF subfamily [Rhodococcus rhodochrous J3]